MNKYQENKLSMYMLVEKVVNENAVIWNDFIAFNEGATDFSKVITNIQAERQKQEQNYKGVRVDKKETVIALIHLTLKHVSAIKVYALMKKEHALLEKISYSKSKLQKLRDTALIDTCILVFDTASKLGEKLNKYGITEQYLTSFRNTIQHLRSTFTGSVEAKNTKKIATAKIKELFKQADSILNNQLDNLMMMYIDEHPEFYITYKTSRKTIHNGIRYKKEATENTENIESAFVSQAA